MSGDAHFPGDVRLEYEPPEPPAPPRVHREHARSKATRLLSAGTYLDPRYRASVIDELLVDQFRVVAPSYGYDAVSVLAHALAARRMRRLQMAVVGVGAAVAFLFVLVGVLPLITAVLLLAWLAWAAAYLRRIATLHTLITRLKEDGPNGGFDGAYPDNPELTYPLIHKIDHEQAADNGMVFYSGYRPFVGAGKSLRAWASAELLIGAPINVLEGLAEQPERADPPEAESVARKTVIPFGPAEIMDYVATRLADDLRDKARPGERIHALTVESRKYATAIRTDALEPEDGWSRLEGRAGVGDVHWREDYESAREYLCVRIGAWNEELVTSVFVGFDIKGNTLYTEFHMYVLAPLIENFYLVDQLPDSIDNDDLMVRVAWDLTKSAPGALLEALLGGPGRALASLSRGRSASRPAPRRGVAGDTSEFGLGRYATGDVDCGARTSVREMATSSSFHHYFQESDATKYTRIVERRLLQIISTFLEEHNVDLADHQRQQTNILRQDFGDRIDNSGSGSVNTGNRNITTGNNSPITPEA